MSRVMTSSTMIRAIPRCLLGRCISPARCGRRPRGGRQIADGGEVVEDAGVVVEIERDLDGNRQPVLEIARLGAVPVVVPLAGHAVEVAQAEAGYVVDDEGADLRVGLVGRLLIVLWKAGLR